MKYRVLFCCTMCVIFAAAIFGGIKRQSYTNAGKGKNYLDKLVVGEIPEKIAVKDCKEMSTELLKSPIILRVSVTGDIEHLFLASRQMVRIEEIYAGSGVEVGQEFYLFSDRWSLSTHSKPYSIQRAFVNIMRVGKEYLVFISKQLETLKEDIPVYQTNDNFFIVPIFSYEKQSNVTVPTKREDTYVPYAKVKNNEFFGTTQVAVDAWEKLKSRMLSTYPTNNKISQ